MAITSIGYNGSVDEVAWAQLAPSLSLLPVIVTNFGPQIASGLDRTVTIGPGEASGWGLDDTSDAAVNLQAGTIASGSRWDTVVLRRDWTTNTTSLVLVAGTSSKAIAAGLKANPGVSADQVICCIRVTAGQSAVQEVWDLREFAPGLRYRFDGTLPDPASVQYGSTILQPSGPTMDLFVRRYTGTTPAWSSLLSYPWVDLAPTSGSGWSAVTGDYSPQARFLPGGRIEISGAVSSGTSIKSDTVFTLPSNMRPARDRFVGGHVTSGGTAAVAFELYVHKDGSVIIDPKYATGGVLPANAVFPISGSFSL